MPATGSPGRRIDAKVEQGEASNDSSSGYAMDAGASDVSTRADGWTRLITSPK